MKIQITEYNNSNFLQYLLKFNFFYLIFKDGFYDVPCASTNRDGHGVILREDFNWKRKKSLDPNL